MTTTTTKPTCRTCQKLFNVPSPGVDPETFECPRCGDPMEKCQGPCGMQWRRSVLKDGGCPNCRYSKRIGTPTGSLGQNWFLE